MKQDIQFVSPETNSVGNALLTDFRWYVPEGETLILHYSFYDIDSEFYIDVGFGYDSADADYDFPFRDGFAAFSEWQKNIARQLFEDIETIINVEFVEAADGLDSELRLGLTDLDGENADGLAFQPGPLFTPFGNDPEIPHEVSGLSGDIWISGTLDEAYFSEVVIHEIGHALGLSHPFEDGFERLDGLNNTTLSGALDYNRYTIMTYDLYPDSVSSFEVWLPGSTATFMEFDIGALQFLYGKSQDRGDDLYILRAASDSVDITGLGYDDYDVHDYVNGYAGVADSGGSNTLLIDVDANLRIDLTPGGWSYTAGGLLTDSLADDNLYLAPETVLSELLLLGDGDHRVTVGVRDVSAYKFVESGTRITVSEIDGDSSITIEGSDQLIFADATLRVADLKEQISELNASLLLSPNGPLYLSAIAGDSEVKPVEAQLYRVYYGSLGRAPDTGGFDWWLEQVTGEVYDFSEVAARFIDSPEFRSLVDVNGDGITADNEFLDHMYLNVFGREADEAGYAWWLGQLDQGVFTQARAFSNMAQSDEFVLLTAGTVSDMLLV